MAEFEIAGVRYKSEKLPAMKQFHLQRRLATLLPPLAPILVSVVRQQQAEKKRDALSTLEALAPLSQPFFEALAAMADADAEYVISLCLSKVMRNTEGNVWASVWNEPTKMPMFADLNDIGLILQIVLEVIKDNLGPFIGGILTNLNPPAAAE